MFLLLFLYLVIFYGVDGTHGMKITNHHLGKCFFWTTFSNQQTSQSKILIHWGYVVDQMDDVWCTMYDVWYWRFVKYCITIRLDTWMMSRIKKQKTITPPWKWTNVSQKKLDHSQKEARLSSSPIIFQGLWMLVFGGFFLHSPRWGWRAP